MVATLAGRVPVAGAEALVAAAARNNAVWCHALCRTHGIAGRWAPDAWTSVRRTPPFYPDAVTLAPGASADAILARIDLATAGASVKDSFCDLDLAADGFAVAHEASWIHRPAGAAAAAGGVPPWSVVRSGDELAAWAAAWDGTGAPEGLFRGELLDDADVVVLARWEDGAVTAGAAANRTGDVVGLSNLFSPDGEPDRAWRGCLAAIGGRFPGLAVVGYEAGEELAAACAAGFEAVGPLRIWFAGG